MKSYTKIYLNYFSYGIDDYISCEICNSKCVDIHHIHARSQRRDLLNDINNLMAVCRDCHIKYGDKNQHIEFLQHIHNEFIKNHGRK
jgi:5-methylcytosine-specific restriction endonuclease McrA